MGDDKVVDGTEVVIDDGGKDGGKPDDGNGSGADEYMRDLLSTYELESPEELKEFIGSLASLRENLGDEDVEDLIRNKAEMEKFQQKWAAEKERELREKETPEETIERLERELIERDNEQAKQKRQKAAQRETEKLLEGFNRLVKKEVDSTDLPQYMREHLRRYLGVDNPIHDIDLNDKAGVRRLIKQAAAGMADLREKVLAESRKATKDKGGDPPKMTADDGGAPSTSGAEEGTQPKNLKEARRFAAERLRQRLFKK